MPKFASSPPIPTSTVLQKASMNGFPPAIPTTAINIGTSVVIDGLQLELIMPAYRVEIVWEGTIQFAAAAGIAAGTSVAVVFALADLNTGALLQSNSVALVRTTFVDTTTGTKHVYPFKAKT